LPLPHSAADFCLEYIRGAEVVGHLDEDGKVINRLNPDAKGHPRGGVRRCVFLWCMRQSVCVCKQRRGRASVRIPNLQKQATTLIADAQR
jgi:hypothetical protein